MEATPGFLLSFLVLSWVRGLSLIITHIAMIKAILYLFSALNIESVHEEVCYGLNSVPAKFMFRIQTHNRGKAA